MSELRYVPPSGPPHARIAIVGEAPGDQEEREGRPFVGGSGQELDRMLLTARINRSDCYITNVMKYRPLNNDFNQYYSDGKDRNHPTPLLLQGIKELQSELQSVAPNVIIAFGGEALRAVTGKRGISTWRGSILSSPFGKVVPTFHPAYILRVWGDRPIAIHDIQRAAEEAKEKELYLPGHDFTIRPSLAQVVEYIKLCRQSKRFAFDIETDGPHVRCLGLSCAEDTAICIPFVYNPGEIWRSFEQVQYVDRGTGPLVLRMRNESCVSEPCTAGTLNFNILGGAPCTEVRSYWSEDDERVILTLLYELFADPSIEKIAQNSPYDVTILQSEFGLKTSNLYMDTMVAWHTCYKEFPKDLGFLCSMCTCVPCYWDYNIGLDHDTWVYNCFDAAVTLEASYKIEDELRKLNQHEYYFYSKHPTTVALMSVQVQGFQVNKELRDVRRAETEALRLQVEARARAISSMPAFNPNSPLQCKELFYTRLGMPPQFDGRGADKKITTNEKAIEKLQGKFPQHKDLFNAILDYRGFVKLIGTYYDVPLSATNRIFTSLNSAGTVTERLSSSEFAYALGDLFPSTNLQNPPRGNFREIFVADADEVIIKADLSSAEWRLVVWFARIQRVIERYQMDPPYRLTDPPSPIFDVHRWFASTIYRKPEEAIQRAERSTAKNGIYGGGYGMQPEKAAVTYHVPLDTARFILNGFHHAFPEVSTIFWGETQEMLKTTRKIVSPSGSIRIFFDRIDSDLFMEAYSHRCQHMVAYLINRSLALCAEFFDPKECYVKHQVHDEIIFGCKNDPKVIDHYGQLIYKFMEYPVKIEGVDVPLIIPAEVTYGPNWYKQELLHRKVG